MSAGTGPSFSYDIGYSGVVKIAEQQLLATGGNMSLQYTPLYTSGVWGATWANASEKIAYAPNYVTMSSSVNYQVTKDVTSTLQQWAFTARNTPKNYTILPNGVAGYQGTAYCIGCSFSASQDSIVSGDISLKTGNVNGTIKTSDLGEEDKTQGSLNDVSENYLEVYPFWASSVSFGSADDNTERSEPTATDGSNSNLDVLDWNASYSSDLIFVMTCCGRTDNLSGGGGGGGGHEPSKSSDTKSSLGGSGGNVLQAQYCCLGTMEATGSLTIFKVSSELKPENFRNARNCTIYFNNAAGSSKCTISFGKIILDSGSVDIQTGTSLIQSSFNFTALGNATCPPMSFTSGGGGGGHKPSKDSDTNSSFGG